MCSGKGSSWPLTFVSPGTGESAVSLQEADEGGGGGQGPLVQDTGSPGGTGGSDNTSVLLTYTFYRLLLL